MDENTKVTLQIKRPPKKISPSSFHTSTRVGLFTVHIHCLNTYLKQVLVKLISDGGAETEQAGGCVDVMAS